MPGKILIGRRRGDGSRVEIDLDSGVVKKRGLRIAIIGESGSGKSWFLGLIAEQAVRQGYQVVVFDLHGEHRSLALLSDSVLIVGKDGDLPLSREGVDVYREAYEAGFSLIFDLSTALADLNLYNELCEPIVRELWRSHVETRRPAFWFIEEAQLLAPQERTRDATRRVNLLKSIAMGGRKFGVMLVLATQRPAELNKGVLSQCYIRFFGRLTERLDREAVKDYLKPIPADELKRLRTGEFYTYGLSDEPFLVEVSGERLVKPGGETPSLRPIRARDKEELLRSLKEKLQQLGEPGGAARGRAAVAGGAAGECVAEVERLKRLLREREAEIEELKRMLAEAGRGETRPVAGNIADRRAEEWMRSFKARLRGICTTRRRQQLVKTLVSVNDWVSSYWLAAETGLSRKTVMELAGVLHNAFFVEAGGKRVYLVEKARLGSGTYFRGNVDGYARAVARLLGLDPEAVKARILSAVYALSSSR